jgi:hypothetical protein
MPDLQFPENPQEWQYANVPRVISERGIRQFFFFDIPFVLAVAYFLFEVGLKFDHQVWWRIGIISVVLMLAFVGRLFYVARGFLIELFRPSSKEKVCAVIGNRLWGYRTVPILRNIFPNKFILINRTDLDAVDPWSKWLGGPANLVIYDGFAAYLEYGNRFRRVVGPGLPMPYLDTRETIKMIVDLRPQFREFKANGWTKDGIKVILGVRIEARIGSDYSPDSADPKLLYPFDSISVRHAVEYTVARNHDKEIVESDWCEVVIENIKILLARLISRRRLDELYIADRVSEQLLSAEVLQEMINDANNSLKSAGIHVSNIQITKTQIPEDVYGQRLDVWKAGKDSVIMRIQGEARAYALRVGEETRSKAQRDLIVSIIRSLGTIDPQQFPEVALLSLSKVLDRGLKDPLVRAVMARETLLVLENLDNLLP